MNAKKAHRWTACGFFALALIHAGMAFLVLSFFPPLLYVLLFMALGFAWLGAEHLGQSLTATEEEVRA